MSNKTVWIKTVVEEAEFENMAGKVVKLKKLSGKYTKNLLNLKKCTKIMLNLWKMKEKLLESRKSIQIKNITRNVKFVKIVGKPFKTRKISKTNH